MLTLSKLHGYLFGNLARTDFPKAKVSNEKREALAKKRKRAIRQDFKHILKSRAHKLRVVLRQLNATQLEIALLGNTACPLDSNSDVAQALDDNQITLLFNKNNTIHQYFSNNDKHAQQRFKLYYSVCYVMHYFISSFIYQDDDSTSFDAEIYKLMVLFDNPKRPPFVNVTNYMRSNNFANVELPFADLLQFEMPKSGKTVNLAFWRAYVMKYGSMLDFFKFADRANALCQPGITLNDFKDQLAPRIYQRYNEYPELANLCAQHHVSESAFNYALETEAGLKAFDFLPNILLDGNDHGHPGYVIAKLPHDPHAYLLGRLTACCQDIDGNASECVVTGIQSPYAGFYVLLKGGGNVFLPGGGINYDNYRIVGQGFTWLSRRYVLVFDSWENLNRTRDNAVIVNLLPKFAAAICVKYPYIKAVTVGTDGATPTKLRGVTFNEESRDGENYDAIEQYLLHRRRSQLDERLARLVGLFIRLNANFDTNEIEKSLLQIFANEIYIQNFEKIMARKYQHFWRNLSATNAKAFSLFFCSRLRHLPKLIKLLNEFEQYGTLAQTHFDFAVRAMNFFIDITEFPCFQNADQLYQFLMMLLPENGYGIFRFRGHNKSFTETIALFTKATRKGMQLDDITAINKHCFHHRRSTIPSIELFIYCADHHIIHLWRIYIQVLTNQFNNADFILFHKSGILSTTLMQYFNQCASHVDIKAIHLFLDLGIHEASFINNFFEVNHIREDNCRLWLKCSALFVLQKHGLLTRETILHLFNETNNRAVIGLVIADLDSNKLVSKEHIAFLLTVNSQQAIGAYLYFHALHTCNTVNKEHINPYILKQIKFLLQLDTAIFINVIPFFNHLLETQYEYTAGYLQCRFDLLEMVARLHNNKLDLDTYAMTTVYDQDYENTKALADAVRELDERGLLTKGNADKLIDNPENVHETMKNILLTQSSKPSLFRHQPAKTTDGVEHTPIHQHLGSDN